MDNIKAKLTPLQKFIIVNIKNAFGDKEKLEKICEEYEQIFHSNLKEDFEEAQDNINRIWHGKDYKKKINKY